MLDCDQDLVQGWCRSAPLFLSELEELIEEPRTLLLDEAQHLSEAGLFIKGLIDRRYPRPVLATASSSWRLGARTRESLAGRASRTLLLPFSLAEVTAELASHPRLLARRGTSQRGRCAGRAPASGAVQRHRHGNGMEGRSGRPQGASLQ